MRDVGIGNTMCVRVRQRNTGTSRWSGRWSGRLWVWRHDCLGLRNGWLLTVSITGAAGSAGNDWAGRSWLHVAVYSMCKTPGTFNFARSYPSSMLKMAIGVDASWEHQLLLEDGRLFQIKRVFGQSIKNRHIHDKAVPVDRKRTRPLPSTD